MPLDFGQHEDVVFRRAPLSAVLCQIRFSPIFALLDKAGVLGFQEALRTVYPITDADFEAQFKVTGAEAEFSKKAPVWRMRDSSTDWSWQVSVAVDFVALETTKYSRIEDFVARLREVLVATERTLKPGPSRRLGVRKVNVISHPEVKDPSDWPRMLRDELVGLTGVPSMPGSIRGSYSELHLDDGNDGTLSIRYGMDPEEPPAFRLDMDYWTNRPFEVSGDGPLAEGVKDYSDSMTDFFHWSLKEPLVEYLEPEPRPDKETE